MFFRRDLLVSNQTVRQLKPRTMDQIDYVYLCTTDRGANEVLARKIVLSETEHLEGCLFLDCDCLEHAPHLIVSSSLLFADELLEKYKRSWKYWSSLAIFANTTREIAGPFYHSYCSNFGALEGRKVKAIFPKPMSQRWNRIHELETRLMRAGFYQIAVCLAEVLAHKYIDAGEIDALAGLAGKERSASEDNDQTSGWHVLEKVRSAVTILKGRKASTKDDVEKIEARAKTTPNALEIEQTKAYTICMSKWRGQALRTAADQLWGKMVCAMNFTRQPLMHMSFFLKKASSATQSNKDDFGALAQLVFGKAAEFHKEFDELLRPFASIYGTLYRLIDSDSRLID